MGGLEAEVADEVHAFQKKVHELEEAPAVEVEMRPHISMMHDFSRSYSVDTEHYHLDYPIELSGPLSTVSLQPNDSVSNQHSPWMN